VTTKDVIENLVDGLRSAKGLALEVLESIRADMQRYNENTTLYNNMSCELIGIRAVIRRIDSQIELLEKKEPEKGDDHNTNISHAEGFYKRLYDVNQFFQKYTVRDNENYDFRISRISYNEQGNDEFIAHFESIEEE
jgi:hypothetical protein